ncbi:helicase-associated domain-containing protein [Streptomyces sp. DSM 44915]|uniref:Helicase-associated domain-containing protein n=1 Tax=Streptomyces chisholmiae TaxID=3075540 RepID=A0ABU2JT14_9ACTN|nr:helicase-associated domain-containing protein [Streptomyces sp. DSM 44915]MDT0268128.1 helicase-associated domain-containing protein [Streptomyces sp. DSM 44915]
MTSGSTDSPRTLADELRARSDAELSELLRTRPDLLSPLPGDLSELATRAGARASVVRALEHLDTFTLQTAEALAVAERPCSQHALTALLPGGERRLPQALATLRARALLWGRPDGLRLVRTAQELLAPSAARPSATGLGPTLAEAAAGLAPSRTQALLAACGLPATHDPVSAVAALTALFRDPERLAALLAEAPDAARSALERLTWGPPYGTLGSGAEAARTGAPLRWLLDRGLLMPTQPGTVVLPREVALTLRDGRAHRELHPEPPELTAPVRHDTALVDATAAGAAHRALDTVETLLTSWETEGPPVLRAGGLGVRELKRVAVTLDVPEPEAVFWLELAYAAGLLAADGAADERYAPTPAYDDWLAAPTGERWLRLATAWLAGTRVPALVGDRDGKGRLLAALGPGLDRGAAADLRHRTLALLAALPPGGAPEPAVVLDRLRWELPRRLADPARERLARTALVEAETLGVTGRGALAGYARPLLDRPAEPASVAAAAELLAPLFPEPVDQVLLQADLTAVAPGPLRRDLRATMALAADVESTGGATVYRFTPGSIRRALDAGWSTDQLHAFLAEVSRTPVPQPLDYLVDDVARRHGRLRVGAAASYLRSEDETALGQLLADRRCEPLRLRRLAPTVLVSDLPPDQLLLRLRELGQAPAAETIEGAVVTLRAESHRTPARSAPVPAPDAPPPADDALLAAAVRAVRAGDHAAGAAPRPAGAGRVPEVTGPPPRTAAADALAVLRAAAAEGGLVAIGYVGADGMAGHHVLAPVRVSGGFVTAFDHTADEVRTYPIHRITGAAPLA